MEKSFRITKNKEVSRGAKVSLLLDDQPIEAFEGETVASALMVNGQVAMRTTIEGDPRGLFCGMGVCFDCLVIVDDVPNTRACMTWVKDGMKVYTQSGLSK